MRLIRRNPEDFKENTCVVTMTTQGQRRDITMLNYKGVLRASMLARTPKAKEFRDWVENILIKIMLTGYYDQREQQAFEQMGIPNAEDQARFLAYPADTYIAEVFERWSYHYSLNQYAALLDRLPEGSLERESIQIRLLNTAERGHPIDLTQQAYSNNVPPLTDAQFRHNLVILHWCPDKFLYRYPADLPNRRAFDARVERLGFPPFRPEAMPESLKRDLAKRRVTRKEPLWALVDYYNYQKRQIQGVVTAIQRRVQQDMDHYRSAKPIPWQYYADYINAWNGAWYLKSNIYKAVFDICGNPNCKRFIVGKSQLHLHHINYFRVGQELVSDLQPLCGECHAEAHLKDTNNQIGHQHGQNGVTIPTNPPQLKVVK